MPSGQQVYNGLKYLDIGIKLEILLYEIQSILFWMSFFEVCVTAVGLCLFMIYPSQMYFIFFHLGHLVRAFIGFKICKVMPKSHELIEKINLPPDQTLNFTQIHDKVVEQARQILQEFMQDQSLVVNYFKVTVVCLVPDAIDCLIQLIRFGRKGDEFSDITMLLMSLAFLGFDIYYYIWAYKA